MESCTYCFQPLQVTNEGDKVKIYCPCCGYLTYKYLMGFK